MKSLEVNCVSLTSSILTFSFQSCISSDNSDNTNSFGFLSLKISFWFNFHCSHRVTTLGWINRFFYRTEWQTEKINKVATVSKCLSLSAFEHDGHHWTLYILPKKKTSHTLHKTTPTNSDLLQHWHKLLKLRQSERHLAVSPPHDSFLIQEPLVINKAADPLHTPHSS